MKLALAVDASAGAEALARQLCEEHTFVAPEDAEVVVVLGGDGFMLRILHQYLPQRIQGRVPSFYGLNCGTLGFLLNPPETGNLEDRLRSAESVELVPLLMETITRGGNRHHHYAINEIYVLRETFQSAHLSIRINGVMQMDNMVGDGLLVSTPAGSTAYNFSAHGPILPLGCGLLAMTPLNVFRPRHWRGALLPQGTRITLDVLNGSKRPVSAVADNQEVREVTSVTIEEDPKKALTLLFDRGQTLSDKILQEQFQKPSQNL